MSKDNTKVGKNTEIVEQTTNKAPDITGSKEQKDETGVFDKTPLHTAGEYLHTTCGHLMDQIPEDIDVDKTYIIVGTNDPEFPIGLEVILDVNFGGAGSYFLAPNDQTQVFHLKHWVKTMDNEERGQQFVDNPTVKTCVYFSVHKRDIAAIVI